MVSVVSLVETEDGGNIGGKRTPKERTRTACGLALEVLTNGPDGLDRSSTRCIAGEHDIKVCEVAHAQAFIEISDLLCCCPSALELAVASMIAWNQVSFEYNYGGEY